jgi:mannose-6-phosphate isomerase-like protein (cupin superfamily)
MRTTNKLHITLRCCAFVALTSVAVSTAIANLNHDHKIHDDENTPYEAAGNGTRQLVVGPVAIKMLLESSNLGRSDIEVGELTLPANFDPGPGAGHAHMSLEIFYVVDGILGHEVNGKLFTLNPGDIGFVKPGDTIRHSVLSDSPLKALIIWVPGGEADRLIEHAGFKVEPVP